MNMVNFLSKACGVDGLENVFKYAILVIKIIQIAAPIALIIWGSIDLLKAVIAGDDKKIKEARKPFVQRIISAVLIFLIPWITNFVINSFTTDGKGWVACYQAASNAKGGTKVNTDPSKF